MAIGTTPTQCGNGASAASSTSWTLTSTAAIDAGEVGVLRIANDNISTTDGDNSEITSVTGGTGTWEKLGEYTNSQGAAAGGVTVATWLFTPSASNASGTVFTITLASARTQKIAALEKWTVTSGNSLRQTTESAIVTSQVDAGAGFGSSSFTGLTSKERLYLRVLGAELSTTASVAPTTNFTALSSFRSSTSSPVSVLGEYRVNTSTGETSNPSFTPTADKAGMFFALEEYTPGGGAVAVDNGSQSQSATSPTVAAKSTVAPDNGAQSQSATSPTVASGGSVSVDSASQTQSATSPTLAAKSTVLPVNASQGQNATSPTLAVAGVIAVADGAQSQAATSPTITARSSVTVQGGAQSQAATSPSVSYSLTLNVANGSQGQAATSPSISATLVGWTFVKDAAEDPLSFTKTATPDLLPFAKEPAINPWTFGV